MNSVAIIETPAGEHRLHYISTLVSNVLRKNSAVDHQTMGTRIHRLVEKANPAPEPGAVIPSPVPSPQDRAGVQQVPPATPRPVSPPQGPQ